MQGLIDAGCGLDAPEAQLAQQFGIGGALEVFVFDQQNVNLRRTGRAPFEAAGVPARHPVGQGLGRHRFGDQVALGDVAAHGLEHIPLLEGFDAFGGAFELELARDIEAGLDHDARGFVLDRRFDERLVDLEFGKRHPGQLLQRRVAGAVVVDRQPEAAQAQPRQAL